MNAAQLADQLRHDTQFMKNVTRWEVIPSRPARTLPFPACLDERLKPVLESRGIHQLYTHQVHSLEATARGEDVTLRLVPGCKHADDRLYTDELLGEVADFLWESFEN
jgi:DEAD/DEAH box helicase domain-containing protein